MQYLFISVPLADRPSLIPAGASGEFSSPEFTFCADSYLVSILPHVTTAEWRVKDPCHSVRTAGGRFHQKTCIHPWPNEVRVGWLLSRHSMGNYQGKWAHTQLIREHSDAVISVHWATVDWSQCKEWILTARETISKGGAWGMGSLRCAMILVCAMHMKVRLTRLYKCWPPEKDRKSSSPALVRGQTYTSPAFAGLHLQCSVLKHQTTTPVRTNAHMYSPLHKRLLLQSVQRCSHMYIWVTK